MLLNVSLYDFFVLSFVQLVLTTVLVLSPAREIGARFRWTGSKITEVLVGSIGAVAIAAVAVVLAHVLWGAAVGGLEMAAFLLVVVSVAVMALQPDRTVIGHVFLASYSSAFLASIVWATVITVASTHSILGAVTGSFVILLDIGAGVVWIANVEYSSDVLGRARRSRPLPKADPSYQPMVSLHIPAYNEPPELLIETIKAVERIDYPNFEVVVVDNNTKDPAIWRPVEEYCRSRERVRFVHVAPWPGYKAGACNLALRRYTDPRAEIIGLVDADDLVQPHYLRETAPYFSDPSVGFVQTFEGNREFEGSPYYTACVDSYQAFYLSVMSSRQERDSVPFVGTMGLFRRSALEAIGGWNEWCISEDTEASLRVLRDGWSGLYIPRCFGRGVVPPSFAGMLTQRHRWCFGAMQILRLHWRSLMPWDRSPGNHLTGAQRLDYLMASLGWFRDLLMVAFSLLLLVITGLLVTGSRFAVAPMDGARSVLPMSLIIIATAAMMCTLRNWSTITYRRALLSLVISLAVAWVIALGCIEGIARRDGVFLRTSKAAGRRSILTAWRLARVETILAIALYIASGLLISLRHKPWLLIFIVFVQATVYVCGPVAAAWNLRAQGVPGEQHRRRFEELRVRAARRRRTWAQVPRPAAAALTALCLGGVTSAFVFPASLLHTTTHGRPRQSLRSLPATSTATQAYLKVGSAIAGPGRTYYPISSPRPSNLGPSSPGGAARVGLSFDTTSPGLLGEVLRAGAAGGRMSSVSLALRTPATNGRPTTELVETFTTGQLTSFTEHLSGTPTGSVSLVLPAASHLITTPGTLRHTGPFSRLTGRTTASAATAYATLHSPGTAAAAYPLTAVALSEAAPHAPLNLRLTTTAVPLLERIFRSQRPAVMPALTLSVRGGRGRGLRPTVLAYTFVRLSVSSLAEHRSRPLSGTASLVAQLR
jgi:cellulose synthase/poly-beta-1,6-N-acetylglucosamine synthase-like glycosyltransferase